MNVIGFICTSVVLILVNLQISKADTLNSNSTICGRIIRLRSESLDLKNEFSSLSFFNSTINYVPTQFFTKQNILEKLYLDFVNLLELKSRDFDGANNLTEFYARGNLLQCLDESVFQRARNLVKISVSSNQISHVAEHAFQGLNKLEFLDLSKNLIAEILFLPLIPNLKHLHLNFNELVALEDNLFKFNKNLEIVEFNYNKIKSITYNSFNDIKSSAKRLALLGNKCINKIFTEIHTLNATDFDLCLHELKFHDEFELKNCKNFEFEVKDFCLISVNEKLLKLLKQEKDCKENWEKQIKETSKIFQKSEDFAIDNHNSFEEINLNLIISQTEETKNALKNCYAQAEKHKEGIWGYLITFSVSFVISCGILVLLVIWQERRLRYRGSTLLVDFNDDLSD